MKFCKNCGQESLTTTTQTFRDGTKHLRVDCSKCYTFNGYAKQHNGFDKIMVKDYSIRTDHDFQNIAGLVEEELQLLDLMGKTVTVIVKVRT